VTLRHEGPQLIMEDYAAGHITTEEAREIVQVLDSALGQDGRRFFPGVSYRHLLVWTEGDAAWRTYPPHDWTGKEVGHLMDAAAAPLWDLVRASWPILENYDLNRRRLAAGKRPANSIWLWGQGRSPQMPTLNERFGLTGAVISAVDLIRGIGKYAGLKQILVPGATGFLDTNYAGKVAAALDALKAMDLVFVHVEAPDEAGHSGELKLKLQAIEDFDAKVVGPMRAGLDQLGDYRLLVLCDHFTPLILRTHTDEPVPFILYDSRTPGDRPRPYTEAAARDAGLLLDQAADLMPRLLER
jgi:2,3-bisphosphoglycerate-independent phosphoglycerate mutase